MKEGPGTAGIGSSPFPADSSISTKVVITKKTFLSSLWVLPRSAEIFSVEGLSTTRINSIPFSDGSV